MEVPLNSQLPFAKAVHVLLCCMALLCWDTSASIASAGPPSVLAGVQERGVVRCGVNDLPGYAVVGDDGITQGFQADLCRAIAAATLGNPQAVAFTLLYTDDRFSALVNNEVDVTLSNVTWTYTRETAKGVAFTTPFQYDGQGFLAHAASGLTTIADAKGKNVRVCVVTETTTKRNLQDYNAQHQLGLQITEFETHDARWRAFLDKQCDVVTGDLAALSINRVSRTSTPDDIIVLPDVISREPLTPVVRGDDPHWESVVRWVQHALVIAEEKGVTQDTVASVAAASTDPELRRLLGADPAAPPLQGLRNDWAVQAISAVGNYGELFSRHLGEGSVYGMARGLNALWSDGGLLYAPPYR